MNRVLPGPVCTATIGSTSDGLIAQGIISTARAFDLKAFFVSESFRGSKLAAEGMKINEVPLCTNHLHP